MPRDSSVQSFCMSAAGIGGCVEQCAAVAAQHTSRFEPVLAETVRVFEKTGPPMIHPNLLGYPRIWSTTIAGFLSCMSLYA